MRRLAFALAAGLALPAAAQDSLFNIGNLVVSQVGDGSAALSAASSVVILREITTAGAFTGDFVTMPTALAGLNRRLTVSGSATSEAQLNFSPSANALVFQGYDAAPGTASIAGTASASVNRVVARIDLSMNVDTTTAFTDAHSANNIRSAYIDGGTAYSSGAGNGVRSGPFGAAGTTNAESGTLTNSRVLNAFGGNLYVSSASGAFVGINSLSGGVATNLFGGTSGTGTPSPYDFLFTDASTCYVTDDRTLANGGGLQKWTFSGSAWSLAYTINTGLTAGLRSLTIDPATGTFYAISADTATKLVSVVDTGAGSSFSTLYQSTTNTNLRGVRFIPVPTPSSAALLGLGGLIALRRRR
jgi:hypothetical protein